MRNYVDASIGLTQPFQVFPCFLYGVARCGGQAKVQLSESYLAGACWHNRPPLLWFWICWTETIHRTPQYHACYTFHYEPSVYQIRCVLKLHCFRSFYFWSIHAFGTVSVWHWKHRKVECNTGCQCTHNAFGNCGKIWFKHTMWEQNVHITYVKMASICTQFVYRLCKIWGQSLFLQKFPGLKPKIVSRRGSDIPR